MPGFNGARVLSFESRRAQEIAQLIRNNGGIPIVAPSTREVTTRSEEEQRAIRGIISGEFETIIFMTGVGARALVEAADAVCPRDQFLAAIGRAKVIVRGPKPGAVMREFGIPVTLSVPEPNTWREIVNTLDENRNKMPIHGWRIAIQEHGEPSTELYLALRERGAELTPIRVYRWELPEDVEPLKNAVRDVVKNSIDVILFTSSIQLTHVFRIAKELDLEGPFKAGLQNVFVASIGPICSEALRENGVRVDFEPSHPKMGFLVKEAAEKSAEAFKTPK